VKKISRQQRNRDQALDRKEGIRVPRHSPQKRPKYKHDDQRDALVRAEDWQQR
jgi:hypothetical protein